MMRMVMKVTMLHQRMGFLALEERLQRIIKKMSFPLETLLTWTLHRIHGA